jgi:hypothetical protein
VQPAKNRRHVVVYCCGIGIVQESLVHPVNLMVHWLMRFSLANRRLQPLGHLSDCGNAYSFGISASNLEHDPEKWKPVFRKDHAQTKC